MSSYGFDLACCLVPRERLVAAGFPKDGIPALVNPAVFTVAEAENFSNELRRAHRGKYLVGDDLVIGVAVGGAARAYPLRIITWHEIVNDTLAGQPLVVTYNPLCDSSLVFERRTIDGVVVFGVSGLLYNSNLLLYDRCADVRRESLWSQLQRRAIAGPAAQRGEELRLVPAVVTCWQDWRERYPETTVLAPDRERLHVYENTYGAYFASDRLRFPVEPLPPAGALRIKTPVLAVQTGQRWHAYTLAGLIRRAGARGVWNTTLGGVELRFICRREPPTVRAETADGQPVGAVYSFWFAWYALQPSGGATELEDAAE